ncbi:hypothetical protein [Kineosporia succinea]|uniref:Uncharacterized protein n=1 Tax=Kineosporia succinea TaxID=84632 RepID=A0ABT9NXY5_9ACTN|nr:hypothetical protein [Kineosporia succinea]MDP9825014.1 hypothetical protein [Kineosporia succinea]
MLIAGSAAFGLVIGWCLRAPNPALVALAAGTAGLVAGTGSGLATLIGALVGATAHLALVWAVLPPQRG